MLFSTAALVPAVVCFIRDKRRALRTANRKVRCTSQNSKRVLGMLSMPKHAECFRHFQYAELFREKQNAACVIIRSRRDETPIHRGAVFRSPHYAIAGLLLYAAPDLFVFCTLLWARLWQNTGKRRCFKSLKCQLRDTKKKQNA